MQPSSNWSGSDADYSSSRRLPDGESDTHWAFPRGTGGALKTQQCCVTAASQKYPPRPPANPRVSSALLGEPLTRADASGLLAGLFGFCRTPATTRSDTVWETEGESQEELPGPPAAGMRGSDLWMNDGVDEWWSSMN